MKTQTRQHRWMEIKMTRVILMPPLEEGGPPMVVADPEFQSEETVGCVVCNMGLDEGKNIECPGQDLFAE